jgi:hypothetical protein
LTSPPLDGLMVVMHTLQAFTAGIWTCSSDLKMYGLELGTRMTIVDLDGQGTLFVHSPIRPSQNLQADIDALGKVTYVVAPNRWHHLFVGDFKSAYPSAKFYCAPGLQKKRKDFDFDAVIDERQNLPWNPSLEHKLVKGVPIFNEVVFYHSPSKTLIVTDLAIHICESRSLLTTAVFKLLGAYGKFGWAKIEKWLYVRDMAAFKASIEDILRWDIEKVLLTHGEPLTEDGGQRLRDAFL